MLTQPSSRRLCGSSYPQSTLQLSRKVRQTHLTGAIYTMPDSGGELRQCGDKMRQHPMSEMSRSQGPDIRPEGQQSQRKPGELPLIGNLGICCKRAFIMIYT
jgi:hypothetical protein